MKRNVHVLGSRKVLMLASVASMIDQFNMPNIQILLTMGYEVHILCNFKEGNTCTLERILRLQRKLHEMHAVCHQWDCPRSIWPVKKCVRAYKQLLELIDRQCFSWIHCHSPIGGALARIAAHKRGIRIIYTAHGFHFYRGAPLKNWLMYYPVEKMLARWTDILLTVNHEDYCLAKRRLNAGRIGCLPGVGIDTVQFQKRPDACRSDFRNRYQIPEDAAVLLSVGELSRRKNHQAVISVLPELTGKNVHYLICGQGKLEKYLLQKAERSGVSAQVHILGFQENIAEFYQNADIFVFPSKQEGLPAALMEAMACGLPCVVSDIRGNRELITDSIEGCGGIRFPCGQQEKLLEALEQLLTDLKLRQEYGHWNQMKVREYELSSISCRMRKIYRYMGRKTEKALCYGSVAEKSGRDRVGG